MIVSSGYRKRGFDAYGGTILRKEDMAYWMDREERVDPRGVALGLGEEIRLVKSDFFELLPTINEIWINNPDCNIEMTEETVQLFKKNNVLFRGVYGSTAEKMARKYKLRFLHLDHKIAKVGDYFDHGSYTITLRFRNDGTVYVHQDCRTQGISASSMGGGENSFSIPKDFYLTMEPEELADKCWGNCYREILESGKLASFMAKARKKKGFYLDFTEKPDKTEKTAVKAKDKK